MPQVKALHEIHRKSEVVAVGATFTATDEEYEYLINVGAVIDADSGDGAEKPAKASKKKPTAPVADDNGLDGLE